MRTVGFARHDHQACVAEGIAAAEAHCERAGLRLTPSRRRVLEMLLREHRALGAYEILDMLRAEGIVARPPSAYRALDFLVCNGFAHKIERLNAFVACMHPGESHTPTFLICRVCDSVAEASSGHDRGGLGQAAHDAGFRIERTTVEAEGVCPNCRAGDGA